MHRRTYLKGVAAGVVSASSLVGTATAHHFDEVPPHVTLSFDESWLNQYRPKLDMDLESRERLLGLYGWRASSPEFEYDWACWWCSYTHQTGVTEYDSHDGDHEPVYVAVEKNTGDVALVAYSAYHWLKAQTSSPVLDGQSPVFSVHPTYHHYLMDSVTKQTRGELFEPRSLVDEMQAWLDNGLEDDLSVPVGVATPESILSRGHWWTEGAGGVSWDAVYVRNLRRLGVHDAADSDLGGGIGAYWPFSLRVVNHIHENPGLLSPRGRRLVEEVA